ncbi:Leu/Phe/Val dehydrogenase [Natronorarus salvus]|uniref:Leu/Phe/Val dehydrogenase n=1 Tax=Natronorarus salvus TaxID=3117733 RepID=UPI002F25EB9C
MVFDTIEERGHEQVSFFTDDETGLRAIVAIHDTTLGPSLGGTRLYDYETEGTALEDVLRLSEAMTYKAAATDLPLGGGKAVILGEPDAASEALFEAYGRAVDRLCGRYVTSVDVNTGAAEMDAIARETDHVVGTSSGLENPSAITAHGVFRGIEACAEHVYGTDSLDDRRVVVQGTGKVGSALVEQLVEAGAEVVVSDVDSERVGHLVETRGVGSVAPEAVFDEECDVFAPCAIGGVVNDESVSRLSCDVVAGAANNVLAERRHAVALADRGILYAPDYVINAGGLITVYEEYAGGRREEAYEKADRIGDRLSALIDRADREGTTVLDAADAYAEDRLAERAERTTPV